VSVRIKQDARAVFAALGASGVICDWREPDVIRLAPVPLYNRFSDVVRCVEVLSCAK
jgi:kynureninase